MSSGLTIFQTPPWTSGLYSGLDPRSLGGLDSQELQGNVAKTAGHLECLRLSYKAAQNYARAFPDEVDWATTEHQTSDFETLERIVPQAKVFPPAGNR
jgi:hypothetical protein